ncbi:hypothetical protein K413DRAFT_4634 [Clostridium sp. ASBs410]|nr:hypothetical protein K413DRAFT_4634 [Clostridium sp. ASBs410]
MNREDELKIEATIKENMEKVRFEGLAAGAKGISGAVLDICNDKSIKNDTVRINKVRDFCAIGLGLKKGKK